MSKKQKLELSLFYNFNFISNDSEWDRLRVLLVMATDYTLPSSPRTTTSRIMSVGAFCPVHNSNCPTA